MKNRASVTFRLSEEQREQLNRLVAESGQAQNTYILSCVLSPEGGRKFSGVERKLGEIGFLLNDILELMPRKNAPSSNKRIQSLMRKYDILMDHVILEMNVNAPLR